MLIDAYLRQGNRAMARRQFERFVAELHRDLGVGPSPGLLELVADVVPSLRVSERDAGVRHGVMLTPVSEPGPADAQLVVRLWLEPHDLELRGRVVRLWRGEAVDSRAARGLDTLVALVREAMTIAAAKLDGAQREGLTDP